MRNVCGLHAKAIGPADVEAVEVYMARLNKSIFH